MTDYGYPKARDIVSAYLRQLDEGEEVSQAEIFRQHESLAEDLRKEFRRLDALAQAAQASDDRASESDSEDLSLGTVVRCPHCNKVVDASLSQSLKIFECHACRNEFSLIRERKWPSIINNFELIERIGMGGFGTVWKARDMELGRFVALKLPRQRQLEGSEGEQFVKEARTAAQLDHPNIVKVLEIGRVEDDDIYIASELIEGKPLSESIENGLPESEALPMALQLASALAYAHSERVIHRDLKPQNVLLDKDGKPHLSDFGLAGHSTTDATLTMTSNGQLFGTPNYMSPEQARSEQVDERSDIYSFGVLLYETLTGQVPFQGTLPNILRRLETEEPISPKKLNDRISRDLNTICLKCLEKTVEGRYQSAEELVEELERITVGKPIKARPVNAAERLFRWSKRNPIIAGISLVACLAFLMAGLMLSRSNASRQVAKVESRVAVLSRMREQLAQRSPGYRTVIEQTISDHPTMLEDDFFEEQARDARLSSLGDYVGLEPKLFVADNVSTVAISSDGEWLAIAFEDRPSKLDPDEKELAHIEIRRTADLNNIVEYLRSDKWDFGRPLAMRFPSKSEKQLLVLHNQGFVTKFDWTSTTIEAIEIDRLCHYPVAEKKNEIPKKLQSGTITPDGAYIAFCDDKTVVVYDVVARDKIFEAAPDSVAGGRFKNVALTADAEFLAAGYDIGESKGGLIRWELKDLDKTEDISSERGGRYQHGLTFDETGEFLAAGSERTSQYQVDSMEERQFFEISEGKAVAFSPNGKDLAVGYGTGEIEIRQLKSNTAVAQFAYTQTGSRVGLAYSAGGSHLAAWDQSAVQVIHFHAMPERKEFTGHSKAIAAMRFTSDDQFLTTGGKDGFVQIWDSQTMDFVNSGNVGGPVQCVDVDEDKGLMAIAQWGDNPRLSLWKYPECSHVRDIAHTLGEISSLSFSSDASYLAAIGDGMSLWAIGTIEDDAIVPASLVHTTEFEEGMFLVFGPEDERIYYAFGWEFIGWLDLQNNTWHKLNAHEMLLGGFNSMAISRDQYLTFIDKDKGLQGWDVSRSSPKYAFDCNKGRYGFSTIAANEKGLIATQTGAKTITVVDPENGREIYTFRPEVSHIRALRWNSKGTRLAVGLANGGLAVWDLGEVRKELVRLGFKEDEYFRTP